MLNLFYGGEKKMALIKCKECGNEISDMATTCPKCGCPVVSEENNIVEDNIVNEVLEENAPKGAKKKTIITICGGLAAVIVIICIVIFVFSTKKKNKYEDAMRLMDDGEINEAYDLFKDLGDYREAEKYAADLYNKITYEEAMQYIYDGEYDKGIDMLYEISDYEEAANTLALIASKYADVSDKTYYCGVLILSLFNDAGYEERIGTNMRSTVELEFGDDFEDVAMGDIKDVIMKEEYITGMVDTINALPSTSSGDDDFKEVIMGLYKMKMDGICANYVFEEDYNSTVEYRLYLIVNELDEDFYDLYDMVDTVQSALVEGESSVDEMLYITDCLSEMTMFSDIDE